MTSYESIRTPIPPGHIARNVAAVGEQPDWQHVPMPADWHRTTEQIINDSERIFGMTWAQIQRKQQR